MTENELNDILKHAGTKGMKWGVRKKDKAPKRELTTLVNAGSKKSPSLARIVNGTQPASPTALAVTVGVGAIRSMATRKRIAKAFDAKPKDFKRKELRTATAMVQQYRDVKLVSGGKEVNFKQSGINDLDDILLHAGVKGMKWGVIRSRSGMAAAKAGRAVQNGVKRGGSAVVDKVKTEVSSIKREGSWSKIKVDGMTTPEISAIARRAQLENDFKTMSKNRLVGTKAERKAYKKRGDMTDAELTDAVLRLRTKNSLDQTIRKTTKGQRTLARNVIDAAAPLAVKSILKKKIAIKDVMTAVETLKRKNEAIEPGKFKMELGMAAFGVVQTAKAQQIADRYSDS